MTMLTPTANMDVQLATPSKDWQAAAAATTDVAAIDTAGFGWCLFIIISGTYTGAGNVTTWTLTEADTAAGSYTAVTGGTGTVDANNDVSALTAVVDCRMRKRFLKLTPTHAGTNTTTPYGVAAVKTLLKDSAAFTLDTPLFTV